VSPRLHFGRDERDPRQDEVGGAARTSRPLEPCDTEQRSSAPRRRVGVGGKPASAATWTRLPPDIESGWDQSPNTTSPELTDVGTGAAYDAKTDTVYVVQLYVRKLSRAW